MRDVWGADCEIPFTTRVIWCLLHNQKCVLAWGCGRLARYKATDMASFPCLKSYSAVFSHIHTDLQDVQGYTYSCIVRFLNTLSP